MTGYCPLIDDSVEQAGSLANQLFIKGVPFKIRAVMPEITTAATFKRIRAAQPTAVMVDFNLHARPGTKSPDLAFLLQKAGFPTVIVTQDRDVADKRKIERDSRQIHVYDKRQLLRDGAYLKMMTTDLMPPRRGEKKMGFVDFHRLQKLREKMLNRTITKHEKREFVILTARLELEDSEEDARIEKAEKNIEDFLNPLVAEIRDLTNVLKVQLKK